MSVEAVLNTKKYHYSFLKIGAAAVPDQQVMVGAEVDAIMRAFVANGWDVHTFSTVGEDQYSSHIAILWVTSNSDATIPTSW